MQNRIYTYLYIIIAVLIALAAAALIFYKRPVTDTSANTATTTVATSTTVTATSTGGSISATGPNGEGYTITAIPVDDRPVAPNYQRALVFDASINTSAKVAMQTQLANLVGLLKNDSADFNAWVSLGNLRLIAGDEAGAKEIWDYTATVWPTNRVSFNNLGDYYANYKKDFAEAEANYLIAVKNDTTSPVTYRNLFNLYDTLGYSKIKAEAILKKGIAAVPKAVDLQVLLARYYRDTGRTADAKTEYDLAVANAKSQGQTSLATSIQTERNAL